MASEKGKLLTCDRCGETAFLKSTGEFFDVFEPVPEGWLYDPGFGDICPCCAHMFKSWIYDFMGGNVRDDWKVGEC